jgi:hypothetical protein
MRCLIRSPSQTSGQPPMEAANNRPGLIGGVCHGSTTQPRMDENEVSLRGVGATKVVPLSGTASPRRSLTAGHTWVTYRGCLQVEAAPAYDDVFARHPEIIEVGFWAHARRYFKEAMPTRGYLCAVGGAHRATLWHRASCHRQASGRSGPTATSARAGESDPGSPPGISPGAKRDGRCRRVRWVQLSATRCAIGAR